MLELTLFPSSCCGLSGEGARAVPREEVSQAHWQIVLSRGGRNLALAAKAATCYDVQGETWEFLGEMRALGAAHTFTGPTSHTHLG